MEHKLFAIYKNLVCDSLYDIAKNISIRMVDERYINELANKTADKLISELKDEKINEKDDSSAIIEFMKTSIPIYNKQIASTEQELANYKERDFKKGFLTGSLTVLKGLVLGYETTIKAMELQIELGIQGINGG